MIRKAPLLNWTIVLVLSVLLLGVTSTVSSDSGQAHIFFEPEFTQIWVCDPVTTITINIEDVEDLTAYHLEIHFDPAVIEVLEVVNGDFLVEPDDVDFFYEPTNAIDNVNGVIYFGMAQQGVEIHPHVEPQSGSGSLIEITLQALEPNQSTTLTINTEQSYLVEWPSVFEIPYTVTNGFIETLDCIIDYYFPLFFR